MVPLMHILTWDPHITRLIGHNFLPQKRVIFFPMPSRWEQELVSSLHCLPHELTGAPPDKGDREMGCSLPGLITCQPIHFLCVLTCPLRQQGLGTCGNSAPGAAARSLVHR